MSSWGLPHVFALFLILASTGALNVASIASVFEKEPYQPLRPAVRPDGAMRAGRRFGRPGA